jgi:hypothetical protein
MIPNRGSPTTILVIKHPIRCRIFGAEQLSIQKEGYARHTKFIQTLGGRFNIDTGSLGQINNHVIFQLTNQRGTIGLVERQARFSATAREKQLPRGLDDQQEKDHNTS